jgi:hypothetical protein
VVGKRVNAPCGDEKLSEPEGFIGGQYETVVMIGAHSGPIDLVTDVLLGVAVIRDARPSDSVYTGPIA